MQLDEPGHQIDEGDLQLNGARRPELDRRGRPDAATPLPRGVDGPHRAAVQEQHEQADTVHHQIGAEGDERPALAEQEHRQIHERDGRSRRRTDDAQRRHEDRSPDPQAQRDR